MPQACKIDAAYMYSWDAVAADSTDYFEVNLRADGSSIGVFTSSGTALVAGTPRAMTMSTSLVAADSVLDVSLEHAGSGKTASGCSVIIQYHNTTSGQ